VAAISTGSVEKLWIKPIIRRQVVDIITISLMFTGLCNPQEQIAAAETRPDKSLPVMLTVSESALTTNLGI
jgi:hypothetical protein